MHLKIIKRSAILCFLGLVYNGLFRMEFESLRYASVLGRIGIAWGLAAIIFVNTKKWWSRAAWCAGILIAYWLILSFIPAPDFPGAMRFSPEGSITCYIDRILLPGKLHYGISDPEGMTGTFSAVSTALLGMLTGQFLLWDCPGLSKLKKPGILAAAGVTGLLTGNLWSIILPLNKKLWTSSFVLVAAGIALIMLAVFYLLMDTAGVRSWAYPFTIFGLNSITIYMIPKFFDLRYTTEALFGGAILKMTNQYADFAIEAAYFLTCFILLFILHRKKVYLKV